MPDFSGALTGRVNDMRVGVPRAFVSDGVDDQVRRAYEGALETLRGEGATLVDIDLPHAKYAVPSITWCAPPKRARTWRVMTA